MAEKHPKDAIDLIPAPLPGWPKPLGTDAMYGLLGDIISTIEPYSEADPAAVASQTLTAFGNVIGKKPHFKVEADRHSANLFICLVGRSARGRKGTSRGYVLKMFSPVDSEWVKDVWLVHTTGHYGVANSLALKLAHITAATADPAAGTIDRDPHGNPTDILKEESAMQPVTKVGGQLCRARTSCHQFEYECPIRELGQENGSESQTDRHRRGGQRHYPHR